MIQNNTLIQYKTLVTCYKVWFSTSHSHPTTHNTRFLLMGNERFIPWNNVFVSLKNMCMILFLFLFFGTLQTFACVWEFCEIYPSSITRLNALEKVVGSVTLRHTWHILTYSLCDMSCGTWLSFKSEFMFY